MDRLTYQSAVADPRYIPKEVGNGFYTCKVTANSTLSEKVRLPTISNIFTTDASLGKPASGVDDILDVWLRHPYGRSDSQDLYDIDTP